MLSTRRQGKLNRYRSLWPETNFGLTRRQSLHAALFNLPLDCRARESNSLCCKCCGEKTVKPLAGWELKAKLLFHFGSGHEAVPLCLRYEILLAELQIIELFIVAFFLYQLFVCSTFNDAPLVHH